jgi:hypothetical protein
LDRRSNARQHRGARRRDRRAATHDEKRANDAHAGAKDGDCADENERLVIGSK